MVEIKICGITRSEDAFAALDCGVRILGFNFYPRSPRFTPPDSFIKIRTAVENCHYGYVVYTGVFVNPDYAELNQAITELNLNQVQLHGDEPPEWLKSIQSKNVHVYKAIRPQSIQEAVTLGSTYARKGHAPALLIDSYHDTMYGGTGIEANWQISRAVAEKYPILLAGGLTETNVTAAIRCVMPWGVDTASGVESELGVKDYQKIKNFTTAVQVASRDL